MSDDPSGKLTGYVNFRDLGGHDTPGGKVRFERVFRSDSLAHAADAEVEHLVEEAEPGEYGGRVGREAQAGTPLSEPGGALEHLDPVAAEGERQRNGEPADSAADDDDLHRAHSHPRD